jgi:hypothetical protein
LIECLDELAEGRYELRRFRVTTGGQKYRCRSAVLLPLPGRSWNSGLCARVASSSSALGMVPGVWALMPGSTGEPW